MNCLATEDHCCSSETHTPERCSELPLALLATNLHRTPQIHDPIIDAQVDRTHIRNQESVRTAQNTARYGQELDDGILFVLPPNPKTLLDGRLRGSCSACSTSLVDRVEVFQFRRSLFEVVQS